MASSDLSTLDDVRVQYAGKKGEITSLLKGLGQLPADERPAAGAEINKARDAFNSALETRKMRCSQQKSTPNSKQKRLMSRCRVVSPTPVHCIR